MKLKRKIWGFVFVVLALMVILSGCESGGELSDYKDTRNFAGSVGPGDFINIEVNVTDGYLDYEVKDLSLTSPTGESGRINFTKPGSDFYVMDNDDRFLMLGNEVLIATDKVIDEDTGEELDTGEEILTALKEMDSNDMSEYIGKYNIITSLEGAPGTVELKSDGFADIWIDLDGSKDKTNINSDQEEFSSEYEYDNTYKAIRIIENDLFKHYGVFLDGEIGIFDSYMFENNEWTGDGMSILVEQDSESQLDHFAGTYTFIDVDGYNGEIIIAVDSVNETIDITPPEESTIEDISVSYYQENNTGLWSFNYDMSGNGFEELWTMMIFERNGNEILVIGTTEDSGGEGIFGSNGDESFGGMIIGVEK